MVGRLTLPFLLVGCSGWIARVGDELRLHRTNRSIGHVREELREVRILPKRSAADPRLHQDESLLAQLLDLVPLVLTDVGHVARECPEGPSGIAHRYLHHVDICDPPDRIPQVLNIIKNFTNLSI